MKYSAGVLLWRRCGVDIQVLLGHPGGPFWQRKDAGAWSIPKGEYGPDEDAHTAAVREFEEETGVRLQGDLNPLGEVKQAGGKLVRIWAREQDCNPSDLRSNTFSIEWPPGSGASREFPEIDRFEWFSLEEAGIKLVKGQVVFLDRLKDLLVTHLQPKTTGPL